MASSASAAATCGQGAYKEVARRLPSRQTINRQTKANTHSPTVNLTLRPLKHPEQPNQPLITITIAIIMQFQLQPLLALLSLSTLAAAAPTQPLLPRTGSCNNGQSLACCDSVVDGAGAACVFGSRWRSLSSLLDLLVTFLITKHSSTFLVLMAFVG